MPGDFIFPGLSVSVTILTFTLGSDVCRYVVCEIIYMCACMHAIITYKSLGMHMHVGVTVSVSLSTLYFIGASLSEPHING